MSQHWSEYWKQGYVTSFGNQLENNYTGKLRAIWYDLSTELSSGFNLLDICTGNASLPLLIQECLTDNTVTGTITAVDLAQVKLDAVKHKNKNVKISILSNVNCEALPFPSSSYDFCISQFGIEYSAISVSLSEVARVLKTGGESLFVLHHSDSRILQTNKLIYNFNNHPSVQLLLDNILKLIQAMGQVSSHEDVTRIKSDKVCEQIRSEINQEIKQLVHYDEVTAKESELMMYVGQYFSKGMYWPIEKKIAFIRFIKNEITASKSRLLELIAAAVSQEEMSSLQLEAFKLGFNVLGISTVIEEQQIIAWKLHLQKK